MKNSHITVALNKIYSKLFAAFGPQKWWPAESPFEVIVGAILTQNTSWRNVERAINNLKGRNLLTPSSLHKISEGDLAEQIRPSGYYNLKAKRLKAFVSHLVFRYGGNLDAMFRRDGDLLRDELLGLYGIGEESADAILLYAGRHPTFVVDAYTRRVLVRHQMITDSASYEDIRSLFMSNLTHDEECFNEYHALLVKVGKEYCRPRESLCRECPLM
ncbi:MAG: endonuclease III domain-containing protein [Deltaproteobacteria bacterium]|nr:endonuclease III domain-containing protein [Deltaproteobacteria bacterium]